MRASVNRADMGGGTARLIRAANGWVRLLFVVPIVGAIRAKIAGRLWRSAVAFGAGPADGLAGLHEAHGSFEPGQSLVGREAGEFRVAVVILRPRRPHDGQRGFDRVRCDRGFLLFR